MGIIEKMLKETKEKYANIPVMSVTLNRKEMG
jgi:hypothetical protein